MKTVFAIIVVLCSVAGWTPAQAQSQLTGTLTDTSGAVVPAATLSVRNVATGVVYTAVAGSVGTYSFPMLPAGEYSLGCEVAGFKKFQRTGLVLETGITRTIDVTLEIGSSAETVTVTVAAPLLESENATMGQLIERASVLNMPLESRRTASLVRLMGNVAYAGEESGEQYPRFALAGGRPSNQMWLLDGGVVQNATLGVAVLNLNPPSETLLEFKVEANNYSAEFGGTGAGLILMSTRSGTNQFHGAAYEFLRNQALDTRTFFAPGKPPLRYNIFGASLGGPIRRNKTFFFLNYEGARRRDGVTVSNYSVPNPAEISGDFSARKDVILIDPVNRLPFPGNAIPASRIDPIGGAIAKLYPAPNVASNASLAPRNNFIANTSDRLTQDFVTAKLDHSISDRDRVYFRYSWVQAPIVNAGVFTNEFADPRASAKENEHHNGVASWIHNVSSTVFNEVRYLQGYRRGLTQSFGTGSGWNGKIGLRGVNQDALANVTVAGLTAIGQGVQLRISEPLVNRQIVENVTWVKGKHQIKTGAEFRNSQSGDKFGQQLGGRFNFSERATGNGLASLLLGWTTGASLVDTDQLIPVSNYWGAFIQDQWKVSPRFTLTLGVRWEMDTPRSEVNNLQSGFDARQINPVAGVPGVVTFAGQDGVGKYAHDFDANNFGPRFGLAYRLHNSTVVRGGYGISYLGQYGSGMIYVLNQGFGQNAQFSSPDGGFTPAFRFRDGMPAVSREPLTSAYGAVPVGQPTRVGPDFVEQNHVNGYAQQWNLSIQRELKFATLIEGAYMANVGHKLPSVGPVSVNMIPLVNGRGPMTQDQRLRPFPQFSDLSVLTAAWGNSSYHSMNLKLEKRYSQGLNFLMNYTFAKYLDNAEGWSELAGSPGNGYTHIALRNLDKSYGGNDIRHRYVASSVYELPFGKGRHWSAGGRIAQAIVGGWGLGVIAELRSGTPYGVIEQTNRTNTFSSAQRPNLLRDPTISGDRSRAAMLAQYFDTSAFQDPGIGVFGNAARNVGFGPGFLGIDLSAHKRWAFGDRKILQFRTDVFNLPNHPNFGNPSVLHGQAGFGSISSTLGGSTGRLIQLSLRLEF